METQIPGFFIYPDFISEAQEQQLIDEIDAQPWMVDYSRRLQYYGFRNELEAPYALIAIPLPIPPTINEVAGKYLLKKNWSIIPTR